MCKYIYIYTYEYKSAYSKTFNQKKSQEFEEDKGGVYGRVWREYWEGRNIIKLYSQK